MSLYTNSSGPDSVRNAFLTNITGINEIFIASPFFTDNSFLKELLKQCTLIRLIVRLGPATSPNALKNVINEPNLQIRYFTSEKFHSKLYILGDKLALVGSANFTSSGLQSNREICVEINKEDERFDKLVALYQTFWVEADVLNKDRLEIYSKLFNSAKVPEETKKFDDNLKKAFGDVCPSKGVEVGKDKPGKERIFLETYRRSYQEFFTAYEKVEAIYKTDGRRQHPEDKVPLRIEIDQFFSFIRETYAKGESYNFEPYRNGIEFEHFTKEKIDEWFGLRWQYLDETIPTSYRKIYDQLSTATAINSAGMDQIFDALDVCHSFHDRFRFYRGGHDTLRYEFIRDNDLGQIKKVLNYLLHGKDEYIVRMGTSIFDEEYKLNHIGRSVIQELLGWVNKENIPICNGRTVKALRYLGARVDIFT